MLASWVERVRDRPFHWAEWDCAIAAADAVETITGENPLDVHWSDIKTAVRQLEAEGGIESAVTARLGEPIPYALAQRGDIVLMSGERSEFIAVCLGSVAAAPSSTGLAFPEMSLAIKAWAVGHG